MNMNQNPQGTQENEQEKARIVEEFSRACKGVFVSVEGLVFKALSPDSSDGDIKKTIDEIKQAVSATEKINNSIIYTSAMGIQNQILDRLSRFLNNMETESHDLSNEAYVKMLLGMKNTILDIKLGAQSVGGL